MKLLNAIKESQAKSNDKANRQLDADRFWLLLIALEDFEAAQRKAKAKTDRKGVK